MAFTKPNNQEKLELFLKSWWSRTYNRPLKDPILEKYTIYELLYEYHDKIEREKADNHFIELENDKIEDEQMDETIKWIEEEEAREREQAEKEHKVKKEEEWMIQELKKELGSDFGEDIDINFSE